MPLSKRPLNLLAINWQDIRNPSGGGAEVHFHEIFKRVVSAGHRVTLLCCGFAGAPAREVVDGIQIIRRGSRNWFNWTVPMAYRTLVRQDRFDAVIDDLNKIPFFTPWFVREPLLTIIHHFFGKSIYLETNWPAASYVYYTERLVPWVYRQIPFAAVSQSTADELAQLGHQSWIELLPNAVDGSAYPCLPGLKSAEPLIGYLGRLKKYKSVEHLIRSMPAVREQVPDARLLIIGDGDDRHRLEYLVRDISLQFCVTFTGPVSQAQKIEYLNRLWLAVNPSPKEGWGLTVLEANACGVPVIAADSPGLRDSVLHGKTGVLYPYGDLARLSRSIIEMVRDDSARTRYGTQALDWARSFTWEASAQKALEILDRVIYQ